MKAWYLIYSKPQRERVAKENLERQGYEAYLPLVHARRRRVGQVTVRDEAMFPRYLFVRLDDAEDDWGPIRSTIGVANLVRFASQAARLPDALITELRAHEDEFGFQRVEPRPLKRGARVRIEEGAFQGYEAIFHASTGKSRVMLLLEIAGKTARLQLGAEQIEAL